MNLKKITFLGAILASFISNSVVAMEEAADDRPVLARPYAHTHNQWDLNWSVITSEQGLYRRLLVIEYAGNQDCTGVCVQGAPGISSMNLGSPYEGENRIPSIAIISIDNLQEGQAFDLDVYSSPRSEHWVRPQPGLALGVEPQWYLGTIQVNNTVDAVAPQLELRQDGYHIN